MEKVIFLDRDGVINSRAQEHEYITCREQFIVLELVPEAVALLNRNGFKVVVVSNQRGIARGLMTEEDLKIIHRKLDQVLEKKNAHIDYYFHCPHNIGECDCRKPETGLLQKAEKIMDIDKSSSYMIGDSESDILAGRRYGVKTIFIGNGNKEADVCSNTLYDAVKYILKIERAVLL